MENWPVSVDSRGGHCSHPLYGVNGPPAPVHPYRALTYLGCEHSAPLAVLAATARGRKKRGGPPQPQPMVGHRGQRARRQSTVLASRSSQPAVRISPVKATNANARAHVETRAERPETGRHNSRTCRTPLPLSVVSSSSPHPGRASTRDARVQRGAMASAHPTAHGTTDKGGAGRKPGKPIDWHRSRNVGRRTPAWALVQP